MRSVAVLEQDLTDEERKRLEEEALLAELYGQQIQDAPPAPAIPVEMPAETPPEVWRGSPASEIDQLNAEAPILQSYATSTDNAFTAEQNRENPALQKQQALLGLQARRFAGVQKYQQLIKDGATREEALALAGPEMYANDVKAFAAEVLRPQRMIRPPVQKFVPGKVTPALRAQEQNIGDNLRELRRALARGVTGSGPLATPYTDDERAALKAEIQGLEKARVDLVSGPESNPNVDQVGFQQMKPAWDAAGAIPRPAAPAASATAPQEPSQVTSKAQFDNLPSGAVYIGKDGRRYRKP